MDLKNLERALDFALDLAEKFNASIIILNVSELLAMDAVPEESIAYSGDNTAIFCKDLRRIHDEIFRKVLLVRKQISLTWRFRQC